MSEFLLGILLEKVIPSVKEKFSAFSGIKKKTEDLSDTLGLIKAVLDDAEEKQWSNPPIKCWLQQLKDAVYILDDVLDQLPMESSQDGWLSSFKPDNIAFRCKVGRKLNAVKWKLDRIAEAKNKYLLKEGVRERPTEVAEWRQTSSTIASPQVFGRDADKEKVFEFLLSPTRNSEFLSVYAIVGLGGLGKTTLAQLVYNDEQVSSHFNLKIWLCISETFNVTSILCSIVQSITKDKCEILELSVMEEKVKGLLQGKKFLLVLDDVWIENKQFLKLGLNEDKWDQLKSVLCCGSKGASVLVSSRDKEVATIMGAYQAHDLSGLSEDDCWSLFKQRAFRADKEEDEELVKIGKEIVSKCGGSPLAAKALGGLMRSRNTKKEWLEVKESSLWSLPNENHILPALRLSYFHLTPTLKQCFAFCAIFPKDTRINKQELIHLWMANGFISSRENVEEVGNRSWDELCQKSFFQDVKIDDNSGDVCFKMHDLVHDLAQSIADKECMCLEKANLTDLPRNIHHIGFDCDGRCEKTPFKKGACEKVKSLRTLYHLNWCNRWETTSYLHPSNNSLRVLCIIPSKFPSLGSFTQLRYLGLRGLDIKTIPDSIYNLRKLEILKLIKFKNLCCLPKHLTRLLNLRHLVLEGCDSLSEMCPDIHKLCELRTLSVYIVKSKKGHNLSELHSLNLGGELSIKGLENVRSRSEAQDANLKGKEDLKVLYLRWKNSGKKKSVPVEDVLEALQPHSNLKQLQIFDYEGLRFPTWMGNNSTLNNLVYLVLDGCRNCGQLPPIGKLPFLKKLAIMSMNEVRYIDEDKSYDGVEAKPFPSLEEFHVFRLPNVERLLKWETTNMFPSLSNLYIVGCPNLQLPCLPHVKKLTVSEYCRNELLRSISNLNGLNELHLERGGVPCLPEGMMNNMTSLATLQILSFSELKELPSDITKLTALSDLTIFDCDKLECLPEQHFGSLSSLRKLSVHNCKGLGSLPDGVRHLTSLEFLSIKGCPVLKERCKKRRGEDWHKIAHVPRVHL
ncbi:putative disease resistance protein RGA4 [Arachis stenosperma]|uniref:putative disease resistance protein RGA4 n=1 Tax=Arachis stenosperma TaxID=217475 RepID=UPI0025AB890A|nr:putative disease resistance protein RGA4 [Arachis stenosperma]